MTSISLKKTVAPAHGIPAVRTAGVNAQRSTLGKVERQTDAAFLNSLVNDPDVAPFVRGNLEGDIDTTEIVMDPRNVVLADELGAVIFIQHQPGFYEAHTQVLSAGRGAHTVVLVRAALHWMFTRTDAVDIATRCPTIQTKALATRIGGRRLYTKPDGWILDGKTVPADVYGLSLQDWALSAPGLIERGHWFHGKLEREYARAGAADPEPHPDDDTHDRFAGMACEMILGGQPHKAAVFYNRWAAIAGYAPITVINPGPPAVIDIVDAVLMVRANGEFWAIECRKPKAA